MSSSLKRKTMEDGDGGEGINDRKQEVKDDKEDNHERETKDDKQRNLEKTEKEENTLIIEDQNKNENTSGSVNNNHDHKKAKTENTITSINTSTADEELEDFEIGASPFVTQTEATQQYCLPAGTLSVCKVVEERPNPRNARWAKVKLYARSEIRQRAHKRFGGKEGLRAEREKRAQQRYEKDAQRMKDLFR